MIEQINLGLHKIEHIPGGIIMMMVGVGIMERVVVTGMGTGSKLGGSSI
jgi:hypothetical protein